MLIIRSELGAPIETLLYVAIFDDADTPAGLAVWVIETAISATMTKSRV